MLCLQRGLLFLQRRMLFKRRGILFQRRGRLFQHAYYLPPLTKQKLIMIFLYSNGNPQMSVLKSRSPNVCPQSSNSIPNCRSSNVGPQSPNVHPQMSVRKSPSPSVAPRLRFT
uniref:Uncharacterized protein n=1 Tax=Meloidogyne incognita TaxID=6306 RepID=A0A914MMX5_MELIC